MKKFFLYAAGLVTLLVLVGAIGAWWSRRGWLQQKAEMRAAGQLPTVESMIPAPVPDADNFAAIPLLRTQWEWIAREREPGEVVSDLNIVPVPALNPVLTGKQHVTYGIDVSKRPNLAESLPNFRHLEPLPGESAAATVLRSLEPLSEIIQEISEGLRRPDCRFPVRYERALTAVQPSALFFRNLAQLYGLRAAARAELGQTEGAADDIVSIIRLARHFRRDPGLLRSVLAASYSSYATFYIWHGLDRHAWTPAQVETFERELSGQDLFASLARAVRFESAVAIRMWETSLQDPGAFQRNLSFARAFSERAVQFGYGEAFYFRGLGVLAVQSAKLQATLPERRPARLRPEAFVQALQEIEAASERWDGALVSLSLASYERIMLRTAAIQSRLELCQSALRLEKEYQARGRYPASTDGLDLSTDFMTGQARSYEVSPSGDRFRLRGQDWKMPGGETMDSIAPSLRPIEWISNLDDAAASAEPSKK